MEGGLLLGVQAQQLVRLLQEILFLSAHAPVRIPMVRRMYGGVGELVKIRGYPGAESTDLAVTLWARL